MKTVLAPDAPWSTKPPTVKTKRVYEPRPRAKTYAKTQPVREIDYFREAREQLAEMMNKRKAA